MHPPQRVATGSAVNCFTNRPAACAASRARRSALQAAAPLPRRLQWSVATTFGLALVLGAVAADQGYAGSPPNILIVTVDDMSADSLGAYGCKLPDTSPNIDSFARESLRFQHAHVQVGNCMPGRNLMWSGLYSHVNGVEGFVQNKNPDYPVLCDLAKAAGYFTAIRGKVSHSTPYSPYAWDAVLDTSTKGERWHIKDPKSYGESARDGIRLANKAGKPFCLMINISDPHKPFYSERKRGASGEDPHRPSRVFTAKEAPVPGFLPEDDIVRQELALYYSSVRRADDCFGEIMKALDDSHQAKETMVLFLSDHGMPLPFAKTQLYHHSTHTPLMVRWPQVIKEAASDDEHMVSAIDLLPTLLDVMGHKHPTPDRLHGRSFMPLLMGKPQDNRDFVILQYNENSGRNRHPMRAIHTRTHLYIYNPWSNQERKFATATTGTMTYRQMVKRAVNEPQIAARLKLFDHRVVEELYNTKRDPDCLNNLVDAPEAEQILNDLRRQLAQSLAAMNDPVAPLLADVSNAALRVAFMKKEDERTAAARRARKGKKGKGKKAPNQKRPNQDGKTASLFKVETPAELQLGKAAQLIVHHDLPAELGRQKLHVTLRSADGQRLHREVKTIQGKGSIAIGFDIPEANTDIRANPKGFQFAAFVGADYESNLQHVRTSLIPAKD